jgi:hypothetical protein
VTGGSGEGGGEAPEGTKRRRKGTKFAKEEEAEKDN